MSLPSLIHGSLPLWILLDNYIQDLVESWAAQWLETAMARVVVAEQYNPDGVEYPLIVISSYERNLVDAEPVIGSGEFHLSGLRYPYQIVVVAAFLELEHAKIFAAAANTSLTDALRADPTFGGLAAANGEYVEQIEFDDGDLYVRGLAGQAEPGKYTGTAVVRFLVHSEV